VGTTPAATATIPAQPAKQSSNPAALGCLGCLGVIVLFAAISMFCSSGNGGRSSSSDRGNMAFIQCQNFVKSRLRAPSTADFPFLDFTATSVGADTYSVRSYVDSQNAFGAELRYNWTCRIKYNGGQDADLRSWQLLDLEFAEQ
jgi:hypothetical protein